MEKKSDFAEIDGDNIYQYTAPKYPMYTLEAARLNSYITFPYIKEVKTDKLVQAGFFYSGRGDNVNCFCCGGALHYQIADDNPWFHHTRCYGNNCLFIRVKKGLHYIDGVLKIFKEMRERISIV
ncbi:death-associated inhibitor of apoptosis 1-like [Lycorma delicatula]|uniref:death-associated inhibitor of apoptosis 1-like n=1 Tax=Lycorma delicatula TaxID=130591 RepID=UPI003F50FE4F